ncbi:glycogenin-1-like [Oculina patagonica]
MKTLTTLVKRAKLEPSWDGTDQGLLNDVFGDQWCNVPRRRLPYTYNMAYSTFKIYRSAHDRYKDQVKVIHFLGTLERKPWNFNLNKTTHKLEPDADMYVKKWWQIYLKYVKRQQERHFQ